MYLLTISGVLLTFGSKMIDYPGAGPLAIITAAFVAAIFWKKTNSFSVSYTHPTAYQKEIFSITHSVVYSQWCFGG